MSKNIFGPPQNQRGVRQNDSGAIARQIRYEEGRKRVQANSAKSPAKDFQGRQNQREAFAQQLAMERQQQAQLKMERELAEERGGANWQRLNGDGPTPTPPTSSGSGNNQAAFNRHNAVLDQKSKRDAAWEAKRRKYEQRRGAGAGGGGGAVPKRPTQNQPTIISPPNGIRGVPTIAQQQQQGIGMPNRMPNRMPNVMDDMPVAQAHLARTATPTNIMPPQMSALIPEPVTTAVGDGGINGLGQQHDALSSHMTERQQKQQKQRAYHADLQRQEAAKRAREAASKQQQRGGSGGQLLPNMGRNVMNIGGGGNVPSRGNVARGMGGAPIRQQQQTVVPTNINDRRKAALQNDGSGDGFVSGLGNGYDRQKQIEAQMRRDDRQNAAALPQAAVGGRRNKAALQNENGLGMNFSKLRYLFCVCVLIFKSKNSNYQIYFVNEYSFSRWLR
jgi:hypothetical protein